MNQRILCAVVILLGMLTTQKLFSQCPTALPEGTCNSPVTIDPFWASSGLPGDMASNPIIVGCESEIDDYLFNGTGPSGATYTAVDVDPSSCPASNLDPTTLCSTRPTTAGYCAAGAFFVEVISYDNDGFRSRTAPVHGVYFMINDVTPPTFTAPADVTIGTDADDADCPDVAIVDGITAGGGPYAFGMTYSVGGVDLTAPAASTDNCGGTVTLDVLSIVDDPTPTNSCSQDKVITWVVEDDCGNTTQSVQRITIVDDQAPDWLKTLVPQNLTTSGGAACPSTISTSSVSIAIGATVNSGAAYTVAGLNFNAPVLNTNYKDDCNTTTLAVHDIFVDTDDCSGSIRIQWSITDACGNVRFRSQDFNITDDETPTINPAGAMQTLQCGDTPINPTASNTCNISFPIMVGVPTATSPAGLYYTDSTPAGGTCVHNSTITRTWQATNGCGYLSTTFDQMLTYSDSQAPTFTRPINVPASEGIECQSDNDFDPLYLSGINPDYGFPIDLMDNCTDPEALVSDDYNMGATSWLTDEGYRVSFSDSYTCFDCIGLNKSTILITRAWTVEDECGNVSNALNQTIWINDNTAPTINGTANLGTLQITDVNNSCPNAGGFLTAFTYDGTNLNLADPLSGNALASFTAPMVSDNCDNTVIDCNDVTILRLASVTADATDPCAVVYTINWESEDECGNIGMFAQTLTLTDAATPVWNIAIGSLSTSADCANNLAPIQLGGTVINPVVTNLDENCGVSPAYFSVTEPPTSLSVSGFYYIDGVASACTGGMSTFSRIWYAVDQCGNVSIAFSQSISITDNTNPTFISPATPISVQTSNGATCPNPNNPTGMVSLSTGTIASGTTFTVAGLTYTAPTESTNPMMFGQYGGDACDANPVLSVTNIASTGTPNTCQVNVAITWRVTDNCGNFTDRIQTFVITDNEAPTLTNLPNRTLDLTAANGACSDDFTSANFRYDVANNEIDLTDPISGQVFSFAGPNISDDCQTKNTIGMNPGNISFSFTKSTVVCQALIATVEWTATDCCGNSATFNQQFTINDLARPVANATNIDGSVSGCHSTALVGHFSYNYDVTNGTGTVTYNDGTTSTNLPGAGNAQFTENCELEDVRLISSTVASTTGCSRVFNLLYAADDECGNNTNAAGRFTQQITVTDDVDPVFTATPVNRPNLICTPDLNAYLAEATATDNCATPTITVADVVTNPTSTGCGTDPLIIQRTYTAADGCTNTATYVQTLTITDNDPPVITMFPADVTVCPGAIPAVDLTLVTATDGATCNTSIVISHVGDVVINPGATGCASSSRMTERTYRATDGCGNYAEQTQTITELDEIVPTFTAPANITIQMDANCMYDESVTNTGDVIDEADNCGVGQANFTDMLSLSGCGGTGTITRIWMLSDDCGNMAPAQVQIITIEDNTDPVLSAPASATVNCGNDDVTAWANLATATDNCGTPLIQANVISVPSDCSGTGVFTYEFMATDACGNATSVVTRTYTIQDNTNPTFVTFPANLTLECGSDTTPSSTGTPTATDGCGGTVTISNTDVVTNPGCPGFVEVVTRTWTATDACGNSVSQVQIINLDDTTPPVPGMSPTSVNAVCVGSGTNPTLMSWLSTFAGATATDACNSVSLSANELSAPSGCASTGCYIYEFFASDGCNAPVSLGTADFCITDNQAPTFDVSPSNMTVQCDGNGNMTAYNNWLATNAGAMASDNCGSVTITAGTPSITSPCAGSTVAIVNFTASDDCGLSVTEAATFTIEDTTAPVLTCPTSPVNLACTDSSLPGTTGMATALDICDNAPMVTFNDVINSATCVETITRTWTATDACGNSDDCVQTIILTDSQMPMVTVAPLDETVECDGMGNTAALTIWRNNFGGMMVTDDCTNITMSFNELTTSNTCGGTSTTPYEFTATDQCGNSVTRTVNFIIQDTTDPVVTTVPTNGTIACDGSTPTTAINAWVANNAGGVATDLCGNVSWTATAGSIVPGCPNTTVYNYDFTVSDECGNSISYALNFSTVDDQAPTFQMLPQDITAECDGMGNTADINQWLLSHADASTLDNCSNNEVFTNQFIGITPNCGDSEAHSYWFIATDECGNSNSLSASITIQDTTDPTLDMPASNMTVACSANIATDKQNWLDNNGGAAASDICGTVIWTNQLASTTAGTCSIYDTEEYVFTATDACGNSVATTATFSVTDNVPPTFMTSPISQSINCSSNNGAELTAWLNNFGGAVATDNCGSAIITFQQVGTPIANCGGTNTGTYEFTATDGCGNTATAQATFTVTDNVSPTITMQATPASGGCNDMSTWLAANGNATATDNCGSVTWSMVQINQTACNAGTIQYTYQFTAMDDCGNTANTSAIFTATDLTPPTFTTMPIDMRVECDGTGNQSQLTTWLSNNAGAVATDACGTVTLDYVWQSEAPMCGDTKTITYDFTATDECGNVGSQTAQFIIEDTTNPMITPPANVTVSCENADISAWLLTASASDNCGATSVNTTNISAPFLCPQAGVYTYEFYALDACGNQSGTVTATYTVEDNIAPVFTNFPAMITVSCGDGTTPASLGTPTATDNCDNSFNINHSDAMTTPGCPGFIEVITRTWTISDDCGNTTSQDQIINIVDDVDPVQLTPPTNMTVNCNGSGNTTTFNTWLNNFAGATASDACTSVSLSANELSVPTSCSGSGCYEYEFFATDDCGNQISLGTAEFCINDNTPPTFTRTARNRTFQCDGSGNTTQVDDWLNANGLALASDDCSAITWTRNTISDINPCAGERVLEVEFTASDICGNANTSTATLTIRDTNDPTITCPANMTNLMCGMDTTPASTGTATATDACDGAPAITFADATSMNSCLMTITRTWTAADDCGNTDDCIQTIELQDNTAPTVDTDPSNMTVECDGSGNATEFVNWITNNGGMIVTDDCNTFVWSSAVINQPTSCNGFLQTTVVEFTATDACNNAVSRQASFIIEDTTPPDVTTVPADASIDCSTASPLAQRDAWVLNNGGAVANDICGSVTWTSSLMSTTGSCALLGSDFIYEFTATDDCGNAVMHTATFSVSDNTAPFFTMLPQSTSVECDGAGNTAELNAWIGSNANAIADDVCSTVSISAAATGLVTNGCGGSSSSQYEFTATDNCGNTASAFAFFTTNDTTDPTITTTASNITMVCGGNFAAQKQAWLDNNGGAVANDICGSVTWSYTLVNSAPSGCTNFPAEVYQFIASDDCGNSDVTTATLIFMDNTPPTFLPAPQDMNVQCGPNNLLERATWLTNNANALATDDCSSVTITFQSMGITGSCGGFGAETFEFIATDGCGNSSTATATFTVIDNTAPTILAQAANGSGSCNSLTNWLTNNGGATAFDNCGSVVWNQIVVSASACNNGSVDYIYEFQATDGCGNTESTFATFSAVDFDAPFFSTNPMDMTVECDGAGNTADFNTWMTTNAGAVAEDACNNATINQTFVSDVTTCGSAKTVTYSFVATDDCGNSGPTRTAQFVIQDTTAPMLLTAATDANVQCGVTGVGSKAQWVNTYGGATVSEACGTVTWTSVVTNSVANCANGGALVETYEFTATDECSNSVTTTATVTAVDNTSPVFTIQPSDMTVECDGTGSHFQLKAWLGNHGGGVAMDDCSAIQYGYTDLGSTGTCGGSSTHTYQFHATDMCGNQVAATASFIIDDTTPPTLHAQANNGTGDCAAFQTWLNANGGAAASDVCGLVTWTPNVVSQSAACVNGELTYNYLFVVADECNNSTSSAASFTVTDNDVPIFATLPAPMTVECDGAGNNAELTTWLNNHAGAVATDACNMVTITNALTNTTNVCGNADIFEYTFTATDDCANSISATALFTIEDTTDPVLTTPAADATVTCGSTGAGSKTNWLNTYGGAIVNDACNNITWATTLVGASSTCVAGNLTETYEFTATDDCSNSVTTTATVTSVDNTGPTWMTPPSNMTFECDGSPYHVQLKSWLAANGNGVATDDCSTVLYGETLINTPVNGCGNTIQYDYRFHVTDLCGNTTEALASFIVEDTTPPTILAQANSGSGDCNQFITWLNGNGGAAATDACGVVTWSNSATPQSTTCVGGAVTYNVTFTVEDECGNTDITSATYSVVDNAAPTFVTLPLSTSVECDGTGNLTELTAWLSNNAGATATDNCSVVTITPTAMAPTVDCGNATTQMFEFVATDGCGNAVTAQASFVITDTTDPVLTNPATDASVQCGITGVGSKQAWLDNHGNATATDGCNAITWTYAQVGAASSCVGGALTETYEFTATDECGNSVTTSAVVTSVDNSGPVFTTSPADMIVECDGSGHHFQLKTWLANKGGAVAMDDCGSVVLGETPLPTTAGCGNTMRYDYQFHATDFCGNQTNTIASFIIQDTTPPTIFQQAQNGSGDCNAFNTWLAGNGGAAAGDACGLVTWSYTISSQSTTCVGGAVNYTVNFAVVDDCGNVANTTANFSSVDTQAPIFTTAPQPMTVECDGAGNTTDFNNWFTSNAGAMATDDCSLVTITSALVSNTPSCGNTNVRVYEFTATDGCGNAISAQASFTIEDTTIPTLTTPAANASVVCGATGPGSKADWLTTNGGATATDICNSITWTYVQIGASSGCFAGALTETYEFTATDDCSNSVTTTAVVTMTDNASPSFSIHPSDMMVECDGSGNIAQLGTWLNGFAGAVATDDCSTPTVFYNPLPITTGCGSTQTRPYEFIATDACGNSTTATASFIIQDNTNPTIFAQANDGSGDCNAFTAWMNANGGAAVADNCGFITWTNVILSQSTTCVNGSLDYSIRFIATDDCGNSVNTVANYTVIDNDVPIWASLPSSMTVECGATNAADFTTWLTNNAGAAATDACNMVTITAALISDTPACGNTSTRLYEFTASDDCGNAISAQAAFTIQDITAPVLVTPAAAATVTCGGTGAGSKANWLATNGGATATDGCSNVTWTYALVGANSGCSGGGNLTETYAFTATDDCNNSVVTTATVTSVDNAGPVWMTAPQDMSVECDGTGNHFQLKTWAQAIGNGVATDDCSAVVYGSTALTPTTGCGGTICYPYQFHATDLCGNQTPFVATFCVVDNTAPTLFASANNFTGDCNGLNAWVNNNGNAIAGDACGSVTWSSLLLTQTSVCTNGQLTHTYQFTATDDCGNSVATTATYTMLDNTAPTFTLPPLSTSVECDGNSNPADLNAWLANNAGATATDACGNVTITYAQTGNFNICGNSQTVIYSFTATDDCGNASTMQAQFTIIDTTDPILSIPASDITVDCSTAGDLAKANWISTNGGANASDLCNNVTWTSLLINTSGGCTNGGALLETYLFTATDDCGNSVSTTGIVSITDTTPPVFTIMPQDMTIECSASSNYHFSLKSWLANNANATATDDCSATVITYTLLKDTVLCTGTSEKTYQFDATDICGNKTFATAKFEIVDTTPPTLHGQAQNSNGDCNQFVKWLNANGGAAATDACGFVTWKAHLVSETGCAAGVNTITYDFTATDHCGNSVTSQAWFRVLDNDPPTLVSTPLAIVNHSLAAGCPSQIDVNRTYETTSGCWTLEFKVLDTNGMPFDTLTYQGPCATDMCGYLATPIVSIVNTAADNCSSTWNVNWRFMDRCGNFVEYDQVYNFNDNMAPSWVGNNPLNVAAECDDNIAAIIAANIPTTNDDCSSIVTEVNRFDIPGACTDALTTVVEYESRDLCGNLNPTRYQVRININDTTDPVWANNLTLSLTQECSQTGFISRTAWMNSITRQANVNDNCDNTITFSTNQLSFTPVANCSHAGTYVDEFIATDNCGNSATITGTYILQDNSNPTITVAAQDTIGDCTTAGLNTWLANNAHATMSDACSSNLSWTNSLLSTTTTSCGHDTLTYEFIASDGCGNTATTTARFIMQDNVAPVLAGVPADITLTCGQTVPSAATVTATDQCDNWLVVTFSESSVIVNSGGVSEIITRTWTATDCDGNAVSGSQDITLTQGSAPAVTFCPSDIGPLVSQNGGCVLVNWTIPTFQNVQTVTSTHNPGDCFPIGVTTVIYTATDACGAQSTCEFDIEVVNYCQPTANCSDFCIHEVSINGLTNTSGNNNGYANFTNLNTTMIQGQTVYMSMKPCGPNGVDPNLFGYWRVWFDYDGDGDFYDAGELVVQVSGTGMVMAQINIPTNATLGVKRMRVAFHHFGFPDPCDALTGCVGEMEDYTIYILPPRPGSGNGKEVDTDKEATPVVTREFEKEFVAEANEEVVDLRWTTNFNQAIDYFIVERSNDGVDFTEVMVIENRNDNASELMYKTKDKQPLGGESFYRLKTILHDDQVDYSMIQKVVMDIHSTEVVLSPNPTKGMLFITMPAFAEMSGNVLILNQLGQVSKEFYIESIVDRQVVDIRDLPEGIYNVVIVVGDMKVTKKVILQK